MRLPQSRRQGVGYVYAPQVKNNISTQQTGRQLLNVQHRSFNDMGGEGFMDMVRKLMRVGEKVSERVGDFAKSDTGTLIKNIIPDSDETARPAFPGETHMILKLANGKNGIANYMGPGTDVIPRVKRGDPGRTPSDTVAKRHDIDYVIAGDARSVASQLQQVRAADNRMIASLKRIQAGRLDAGRNIQAGMRLIQAKEVGEDLGLLDKSKFAGPLTKLGRDDSVLLKRAQDQLSQEGYGLPGDVLREKVLKSIMKERARGSGASYSKTLPGMKAYKMSGSGLNLPGGATGELIKFITRKMLPSLVKTLRLPRGVIKKVQSGVPSLLKGSKSLPDLITNLSRHVLPILVSGNGLTDVLKGVNNDLNKKLASGMWASLKWYLNKAAKASGSKPPFKGSGLNLPGGSFANFWKGFKKGFTTVFKPGSEVLSVAATALGQPEIGVPLGILSKAL